MSAAGLQAFASSGADNGFRAVPPGDGEKPASLSLCRFQRQEAARPNRFKRLPKLRVTGSSSVVRF
jgi:hypothetical protein